jgi:phosphomethylpyrimidine synthase
MSSEIINQLENSDRLMPIVSRGGGIMHEWIKRHGKQNPYLEHFDRILAVARKHNVPITFVSSLRSGTVVDGFDKLQEYEWAMLSEYIKEAHSKKVSVIVDGLGHITIDQIPLAVNKFKELCYGIPLGVLGPAVTDRGLGHEHVVNAIGTSIAVWSGANYCNACYRTEHLGLPELQDISEGIGAAVIATYSGDLAREQKKSSLVEEEWKMSAARKKNQWGIMLHGALDNKEALKTFQRVGKKNVDGKGCSICGDLCPFVITGQVKKKVL